MQKDYSNFWALYARDGHLKATLARAHRTRNTKTETAELEFSSPPLRVMTFLLVRSESESQRVLQLPPEAYIAGLPKAV